MKTLRFCVLLFTSWLAAGATMLLAQDEWTWLAPQPSGNRLVRFAYGNSQFVGVGLNGAVRTSPDGRAWTNRESGTLDDLQAIVFDGTRFIAVGGTSILSSTDGVAWSRQTATAVLSDLVFGDGHYIAIAAPATESATHRFLISTDAIHWTLHDHGTSVDPLRLAYSHGIFVAAGHTGSLLRSTDATTWTAGNIGATALDYTPFLVADPTQFVASWHGAVHRSIDGVSWTAVTTAIKPGYGTDAPTLSYNGTLGYAGGLFVLDEGRHGWGVAYSSDAQTWHYVDTSTDHYTPFVIDFSTLAFGGQTWIGSEVDWWYANANPTSFATRTSTDGINWPDGATLLFPIQSYSTNQHDAVYGLGRFFFDGKSSPDTVNWVASGFSPTHAAGAAVFRLPIDYDHSSTIQVSFDGLTGVGADTGVVTPKSVAYGAGRYVIVGVDGKISTSTDALHWTATASGTDKALNRVTFALGRFIAVGAKGTLLTSADGLAWTATAGTRSDVSFSDVTASADRLLVVFESLDLGATAPSLTLGDGTPVYFAPYRSAAFFNGAFLATSFVPESPAEPYAFRPMLWKSTDGIAWTGIPTHLSPTSYTNVTPSLAVGNNRALFTAQPGSSSSSYVAVLQSMAPVVAAPAVVVPPAPQTIARGETAAFAVGATGSGTFAYQWFHDGAPIDGATSSVFQLPLAPSASAGAYTVKITNSAGSATSPAAQLTIVEPTPLTIVTQPVGGALQEQSPVLLAVTVTGSGPIAYQWRKNGQPVSGATAATYEIYAIASTYDYVIGDYDVVVTAPFSSVTSRSVAVTWGGPTATFDLSGIVTRRVGESLTVHATVVGQGPFTYQWFGPGVGNLLANATSPTLVLTNLMPANSSPIALRVTDAAGNESSFGAINLVVLADYDVSDSASTLTIAEGRDFSLGGGRYDTPSIDTTYQWFHDGVAIPGATQSGLVFKNFSIADGGEYRLEVRTSSDASPVTSAAITLTPDYARLVNLSARAFAGTGEETLIEGFVLTGEPASDLVVRSVGPDLTRFGLLNGLADPALRVIDAAHRLVAENDDWSTPVVSGLGAGATNATFNALGAFTLTANGRDSALILRAAPSGLYSANVPVAGTGGIVLNEIYAQPASRQRLVNLSARARVGTGDDVLIGGFVIAGTHPLRVLIRGVGPALGAQGVAHPVANPKITLYRGNTAIHNNDNWNQATNLADLRAATTATGAFALTENSNDAAMLETLPPGVYSVHVTSVDGSSGVALVEIYEAP